MMDRIRPFIWDLFINGLLSSYFIHYKIRNFVLRSLKFHIGKQSAIHSKCLIIGRQLILGSNSYINRECVLDSSCGKIIIGDKVGIGFRCSFLTTNHDYSDPDKRTGNVFGKDIIVEDGCWIGANSTILSGVKIGRGGNCSRKHCNCRL